MANAERDLLPKTGKVNEMCREWLVREDGALAYQLQNQEITEHYKGNKQRNALVREDFPRALDEQLREKQLAEQAAMVYHQMLEEQEKIDSQYAKELAQKLEWEEKVKKQALQMQDQFLARQIHEETTQYTEMEFPNRPNVLTPPHHSSRPNDWPSNNYHCHTPRRQARPMPLPNTSPNKQLTSPSNLVVASDVYGYADPYLDSNIVQTTDTYAYSEVYKNTNELSTDLNRLQIVEDSLPADELIRRKMQEEKDAKLARELQERENIQLDRDRLMAIEAQDKELAKLLQEKERQKVKRARERAKQKSLMKKQQQKSEMDQSICPDESYSDPVDLIPSPAPSENIIKTPLVGPNDDIVSYSLPADVVKGDNYLKQRSTTSAFKETNNSPDRIQDSNIQLSSPSRPTNLSLKSVSRKHAANDNNGESPPSQNDSPSKQMSNIAIAIDPTYNRRSQHFSRSSKGSPSVAPSSTSSSSSPNTFEDQETSPVPPYMPIQGQRRTSSLEKKHKKKVKDGCKQQ